MSKIQVNLKTTALYERGEPQMTAHWCRRDQRVREQDG